MTTFHKAANSVAITLGAAIDADDLAVTLTTGHGAELADADPGPYWLVFVDSRDTDGRPASYEIVEIESRSTDTLTVTAGGRGAQGTTATAHLQDCEIELMHTAGAMSELHTAIAALEAKTVNLSVSGVESIFAGGLSCVGGFAASNGAERVTNGTFDTVTTGWTPYAATLSVASARLRVTCVGSGAEYAYQLLTGLTVGKRYKCTVGVVQGSSAAAYIYIGRASSGPTGTGYVDYYNSNANTTATHTVYFTATHTTANITVGAYNLTYTDFDNISLVEIGDAVATQYRLSALNIAPATAASAGVANEVRITADAIYVCTATNTWKKVAIATW